MIVQVAVVTVGNVLLGGVVFVATAAAIIVGYGPIKAVIADREQRYGFILRSNLLIDVVPRTVTVICAVAMVLMGLVGYVVAGGVLGAVFGIALGAMLPTAVIRTLRKRRIDRLEGQLVSGIQTLAAGVRAGLNLVQSMELIGRDGPVPLQQEFAHLLREYDYGVSLEQAMDNAADRIGSGDFRLLFSALHTHRQRGGDLGQTLDRIAESIREIQRLENRVKTLTAQGRATARWLGAMPAVVLGIYYLIDSDGVRQLFVDNIGRLLLLAMVLMNVIGFLWIKKVVSIDI